MANASENQHTSQEATLSIINQQEVLGKNFAVYGTYENPLFLAKDVAEWIEHSQASVMIATIDEDEKLLQICDVNNFHSRTQSRKTQICGFSPRTDFMKCLCKARSPSLSRSRRK